MMDPCDFSSASRERIVCMSGFARELERPKKIETKANKRTFLTTNIRIKAIVIRKKVPIKVGFNPNLFVNLLKSKICVMSPTIPNRVNWREI